MRACGQTTNLYLEYDEGNWDIAGMLHWLEHVLAQIAALGEKALIIGHEKPGCFRKGPWPDRYMQLVTKYKDAIVPGSLFGHQHSDSFNLLWSSAGNASTGSGNLSHAQPVGVAFAPSSLTPLYNCSNPSYRVYELSAATLELRDYAQWRMDLALANKRGYPTWFEAYRARRDYKLADMSPTAWLEAGKRVGSDQQACEFMSLQVNGGLWPSNDCASPQGRKDFMCSVITTFEKEYDYCMQNW